jgi:hypothetical protein
MKRTAVVLAFVSASAFAQGVLAPGQTVPIALQVQRIAPQLVAFAGSQGNFENLVNGIALGAPVTLTTVGADGVIQTVTFVNPGGAVSDPVQIAQSLERARQQLIASGIATPTAQQLAEQVSGTTVPVAIGTLPAQTPGAAAAGGSLSPAQQLQTRNAPVAPQINTSDSRIPGNTSNTPVPPVAQPVAPPASAGASPSLPPPRR